MLIKNIMLGSLASLGLMLGVAAGETKAQMPHEMSPPETNQTNQFRSIEQPLGIKIAVTAGGLALIGLELWWFLLSKSKSQKAQTESGIQEMNITVDGGYEPSRIIVNAGQPVRLNFWRRDASSCLEKVLLPDFHLATELKLNQVTSIEFTPETPGEYTFTCGMNMFRGIIEVQESNVSLQEKLSVPVA